MSYHGDPRMPCPACNALVGPRSKVCERCKADLVKLMPGHDFDWFDKALAKQEAQEIIDKLEDLSPAALKLIKAHLNGLRLR